MEGRTAIVTGGAQGIGAAYAGALASAGVSVAVLDVADPAAVAAEIRTRGGRAEAYRADITRERDLTAVVDTVVERWGSVDILINNAALFATVEHAPFETLSVADFERVLQVNVIGQFICAKAVAPRMKERRWGRIVNISSGAALKGIPWFLHYVTSKGAIVAFTRALARELGPHRITVNAIAPGLTLSESVLANPDHVNAPLQSRAIPRDQHPDDLLGTLLWLCSEGAAFVTGQTVAVDGGSVML